jgi:polar amino acid transport system substrate-binding protein
MNINKILLLSIIFVLLVVPITVYGAEFINICTDSNYWYPYSYEENGVAKGTHIDIVTAALTSLGHQFKLTPLPWKRCLSGTGTGKYNALISASYQPGRAEYLIYPGGAATSKKSPWRIGQVKYVIVSNADDPYEYDGNLNSLPHPVRAPLGYSIVDDLEKESIEVKTSHSTLDNAKLLVRTKKGVLITPPENAMKLNEDTRFREKLKIHDVPIASKSYYFVFSKKNPNLKQDEIEGIWKKIRKLRKTMEE